MAKTTFLVAGLLASLVGYGIYFDYKRRTNPEFRRKLGETEI
jgi:MAS20 protein import receptor